MKKTERQNGILYLLSARKKMTANELANYFEVSPRTIYRDIDALSQLRIPIISYEGLCGGYEIDPSYFIPSIKLGAQEILMLLMVLKAGERLHIPSLKTDYNLLRSKLIHALTDDKQKKVEQVISHIDFDLMHIFPSDYIPNVINPILEAFEKSFDLQISYYHPGRDETTSRQFSPIELLFDNGGWYLYGYCHLRQEKRTLRLDRIVSLTCLEVKNPFSNEKQPVKPKNVESTCDTYEIMMDPALYRTMKDDMYLQQAIVTPIGQELHLTVQTPYKRELLQLVLSHPQQVTLLKPDSFLTEAEEIIQKLFKKYQKP